MLIEEGPRGVSVRVWVQPKASKDEVEGIHGEAIKIRVAAPPVDGEANAALVKFLAKKLGVSRASIEIVQGETGRRKVIRVAGVSAADVRKAVGI